MPKSTHTKEELLNLLNISETSVRDPVHILYLAELARLQDVEIQELKDAIKFLDATLGVLLPTMEEIKKLVIQNTSMRKD